MDDSLKEKPGKLSLAVIGMIFEERRNFSVQDVFKNDDSIFFKDNYAKS